MRKFRRLIYLPTLIFSVFFIQTIFLKIDVHAQEPPEDSIFIQTISSLFSESDSISNDQVYQEISSLGNDYSVLKSSDPEDFSALEQLISDFESEKASYFLNGSCTQADSVKEDWDLEKEYMKFGFSGNETFLEFIPRVYVTGVSEDNTEIAVDLYEWMGVRYQDPDSDSDSISGYGYSFTLQVSKVSPDSVFSAVGVENTDQNFKELEQEGVIITSDGISFQEEADADDGAEEALVGSSAANLNISWVYNVSNAVAYADKWALGRNSSYTWWGNDGGDCANFVSQCLFAGGFPKTSVWYPDASSWIGQNELRAYLLQIGAGKLLTSPKQSDVRKGDLIWYNWDGQGTRTNHITICVGKNSSGVPVIDSHTSARFHYKWNYGGSSATYMVMQMNASSSDYVPVYRLYNKNSGEHFYTGSEKERNYLEKQGWKYEGVGWLADDGSNATTIYRLYNPNSGDHHFTANYGEMLYLKQHGWKYEGELCRTVKKSGIPLYRLYNPNAVTGSHHYTKNKAEAEYLEKQGWKYEGIAWYSKD